MHVLGISAYFHDSAAALLDDGRIVAAAQEERFTRRKGDASYPRAAIRECLRIGGLTVADLDLVAFFEKPLVKFDRLMSIYRVEGASSFGSFKDAMPRWANHRLRLEQELLDELGDEFSGRLVFADHHESHAASAFFPSPFQRAAVVTLDAVGEWTTTSIARGVDDHVELVEEMRFPHSLGMLYSAFTYYTGFKVNSGEYKMMGLAPYGEPRYADLILEKVVDLREDGSLWLDMSYFDYVRGTQMTSQRFHQLFGGAPRAPESVIEQRHMDLAASVQLVCEEAVLGIVRHAHEVTGEENLALAGGVALNCVANGRVLREGPFEDLWVQPAAGDAGGALGAAFLAHHHYLGEPREVRLPDAQRGSFLGPSYDNETIESYLDGVGATWKRLDDERELLDTVVDAIDAGKVVGWFHGRMEFGPRALGGRSIIGDPRSPLMQQQMNLKIKFRESFRPFAPCVLREHADEVFELEPEQESPYMLLVAEVRKEHRRSFSPQEKEQLASEDLRVRVSVPRSTYPAITHVDFSARVQSVDEERHGRFHALMTRFYERTGCPVVINTSFNIRGEPIVGSPAEAYRCFMSTEMDVLVLEDCVLQKTEQPQPVSRDEIAAYHASHELD